MEVEYFAIQLAETSNRGNVFGQLEVIRFLVTKMVVEIALQV